MIDPRIAAVERRLAGVARLLAITGGKGGIGKSSVATTLALVLAERGSRVGLLDLDLTGPSDHVILGFDGGFPEEDHGVVPASVHGVRFMSVRLFSGDRPAPMRGQDVTNALLELVAITRWGELDHLVVDMPPGLGDATLDAVRLFGRAEHLVVGTPSRLALETVGLMTRFLTDLGTPVAGLVANMVRGDADGMRRLAADHDLPLLAELPYDDGLETALGDVPALLGTPFADAVRRLAGDRLA